MITQDILPRSAGVKVNAHGFVVFDLDGTLLRGQTVCEVLAAPLGRLDEMNTFESLTEEYDIAQARVEMTQWYRAVPHEQLIKSLASARWAPGAFDGVARLVRAGMAVAVASITWDFAVNWFAHQLGLTHVLGTKIDDDGTIKHVWPRNKGEWLRELHRFSLCRPNGPRPIPREICKCCRQRRSASF